MRETRRFLVLGAVLAIAAAAQDAPPAVEISGAVKQPLALTADDLAKMPQASVKMSSNGLETTYEGVWLHEILKRAGVPSGSELRGKALTTYLLVEAKDGYQVLFSLAEIDPAFTENQVLLADKADGKPLVGSQGPFRLVAVKDKPGARSIRMVSKIEVVQLRK
jgi:DMSO/TMAO reductase YedYZ molybdopterin-dependent catalytic subunit